MNNKMNEAVYLMERTWEGPQRLFRPNFIGSRTTSRPLVPPIDTSLARKAPQCLSTPLPDESPDSAESTPCPSPLTALTIPSAASPTMRKVDQEVQMRLGTMEAENRELKQKMVAMETQLRELRRSLSSWTDRYVAEVVRNRQAEEQFRERIQKLSMCESRVAGAT